MLTSFGDKDTKKIWEGERVKALSTELQEMARRKLRMLNNSQDLNDLLIPPANRLEKLKGNLKDFYSIRINNQWRIIFKWNNGNAEEVSIIDYPLNRNTMKKLKNIHPGEILLEEFLIPLEISAYPTFERYRHSSNTSFGDCERKQTYYRRHCTTVG
jgi:proteic killer suppression protein